MRLFSQVLIMLLFATVVRADSHQNLASAEADYSAVWNNAEMSVENAMFVDAKAEYYGGYTQRDDGPFPVGETFLIYAEPKGYGYFALDGLNEFGVILDFEIETSGGTVILQQNAFQTIALKSRNEAKEMFLNLSITLNGLAAGNFVLRVRMHDLSSEENTSFDLPFTIE